MPRTLLPLLLLSLALPAQAASVDLSFDNGLFARSATPSQAGPLSSGVDLAVNHRLLNIALDYDFQVTADRRLQATQADTLQRLATSFNSRLLNKVTGGQLRLQTDSTFVPHSGAYIHRVSPVFSRRLAQLGTLRLNYLIQKNRPSELAAEQLQRAFTLGLRGTLRGGAVNWAGRYRAADVYNEQQRPAQRMESLHVESDYRVLPRLSLRLAGGYTAAMHYHGSKSSRSLQALYGAGLSWKPSAEYAVDINVRQVDHVLSGEESTLHSGSVSWFPNEAVAVSLNYGDQLVEGTPAIVLNTRLLATPF